MAVKNHGVDIATAVDVQAAIYQRGGMAMTAAERKLIQRNLDLIFELEKYVLEHPEFGEKILRNAVVFMKVAGDEKFNV
jgi:hypothetical protein